MALFAPDLPLAERRWRLAAAEVAAFVDEEGVAHLN